MKPLLGSVTPKDQRLIGIPTVEGMEIIQIDELIRCEGLQKCTRIVTCSKKNIISSYNIGEFKKLLGQFGGFFFPHRSYIVNVLFVDKFRNAGELILKDGTSVPVSKSKKREFLEMISVLK